MFLPCHFANLLISECKRILWVDLVRIAENVIATEKVVSHLAPTSTILKVANRLSVLETPVSIQALIEAALGLNNTLTGDR